MKLTKLNQAGFAHYVMPLLVVAVIVLIGIRVLTGSHADNVTPTANLSVSNTASTSMSSTILNYSNVLLDSSSAGLQNIPYNIDNIGSQTVVQVAPSQKLSFGTGGKVIIKNICYYFKVAATDPTNTTAIVQFVAYNNTVTKTLTDNTAQTGLDMVCVNESTTSTKSFTYNIYNKSASNGPNVLLYQAISNE